MSTREETISIPTGTWHADVIHSPVGFEVPYMGISTFSGTAKDFQATLADGTLTGSAQIASLVARTSTTFWVMESIRLDLDDGSQVHP